MPRRMSCSITVDAVRARAKTVTRRHVDTWTDLKPGDRLTLIEKGMGLKKGEKQVVLAEVEVLNNTVQPLYDITYEDVLREGFTDMDEWDFIDMWLDSHHITFRDQSEAMSYMVRRIAWRYLDAPTDGARNAQGRKIPTGQLWPESDAGVIR